MITFDNMYKLQAPAAAFDDLQLLRTVYTEGT